MVDDERYNSSTYWAQDMGHLCSICSVNQANSMHHLVPNAVKKKGQTSRLIPVCRYCHAFIHKAFTLRELAEHYDTEKKLKASPLIKEFVSTLENNGHSIRIKYVHIINGSLSHYGKHDKPTTEEIANRPYDELFSKKKDRYSEDDIEHQLKTIDDYFSKQFSTANLVKRGIMGE